MPSPNDLQNQSAAIQWSNGRGLVTGAMLSGLIATIVGIFATMGTWSGSGVYTPSIPAGTITGAQLATGAAVANLGATPCPAAGCTMTGPLSAPTITATVSASAPIVTSPALTATGPIQDFVVPFASLPVTNVAGQAEFCSDCRKPSQAAGAGTGIEVTNDGTGWFSPAGVAATH